MKLCWWKIHSWNGNIFHFFFWKNCHPLSPKSDQTLQYFAWNWRHFLEKKQWKYQKKHFSFFFQIQINYGKQTKSTFFFSIIKFWLLGMFLSKELSLSLKFMNLSLFEVMLVENSFLKWKYFSFCFLKKLPTFGLFVPQKWPNSGVKKKKNKSAKTFFKKQ